ncbi:MAG: Heptaprenyl diphosphate synthase component [Firmicutes bacterium]|nr:Heptaprenyl diphosphate synthase component [Bacillota bacterium]
MNIRRMVLLALFVAVASVLHVVEAWLPLPFPVPGIKLGLANVVSLLAIGFYGWRAAIMVAVLRVMIGSLFGGTLFGPAFAMSMGGALFSTMGMGYMYQYHRPAFSVVGVSIIGAVIHNAAQIVIAALLVVSAGLLWYLPYLILFAVLSGAGTGFTAAYILAKMPRHFMDQSVDMERS